MKVVLFRVSILFFGMAALGTSASFAQSGWFWQNPLPQGNFLFAAAAPDASTVVAVGDAGTILRTDDGGATWTPQSSGTTQSLNGVSFVDANTGTAVGGSLFSVSRNLGGGTILRTTDGGATWTPQASAFFSSVPGRFTFLLGVSFVDANTGTAVGEIFQGSSVPPAGIILRTTDGGATWTFQFRSPRPLRGVSFGDANTGTAVGFSGRIFRTADGGATWTPQSSGTTNELFGVSFVDANTGTAVGVGGTILRTDDGGATWTPQSSGTPQILSGVSFVDANTGTAVGSFGTILRTTDGGATWTPQS